MTDEVWHIVIVDGNADDRAQVRRLLLQGSDRRYAFTEAATGAAGLRALRDAAIAEHRCLVLAYDLPDMDAPEFLAAISDGNGVPERPVVVFTRNDSAVTSRSALRAGAHDYIGKAWMTQQGLLRAIENASERWAMARELQQQKAAAQTSERHLQALAQATSDIVYRMSADWSVMLPLDGRALVASSDAPLEDWAWLRQNIPVVEHVRIRQAISEAIARKALFNLEHRVLRPDGTIGWTSSRAVPILDANGNVLEWFGAAADITQRKAAEEALRASAERFRLAAEAVNGLIYDVDLASQRVVRTKGLFRILGYQPDEVPPDVAWWKDRIHPDDVAARAFDFAAADGKPAVRTYRIRHKDGRWLHVEDRSVLVHDESGNLTRMVGSTIDVSDRVQAEIALRQSENFLQRIAAITPGVLHVFDLAARRSVFINRTVASLLGFTREQVTGMGPEVLASLMHPEDVPRFEQHIADVCTLADGDVAEFEHRMRDRAGEWHWFHACDAVFARDEAGAARQIIGVATDITARKEAELALARRERELQTLTDNTPDILFRLDRQRRHVFINAAVERVTGLAPAAYLGKTNREMGVPIERCEMWDAALNVVFDKGEAVSREFSYDAGTGVRHFQCTLIPERGTSGEVDTVLGLTRDRTDAKQAYEALRLADRRKDEFLATLAHELRNPLAPMRTGLQLLQRTQDRSIIERTHSMMERQLGQMVRLIDDLLDVSRITSGKVVLRPASIELQAALQTAIEAVQPLLVATSQALQLNISPDPIWIHADPTRISQVLSNLLTNAAKYSPQGSSIALTLHQVDGTAVVTVTDSGEGIPQHMLAQIFEMFTQVDRTLDRAQGGLGIGLALVKRLVEMHGGTVSATSAGLGAGSTFTLRLPTLGNPAENLDEPVSPPVMAVSDTRLRILVVDDNVDAAESLAVLLTLHGHETRVADSGAAALVIAREFKPAVAFLDIGMPGMNGYDTARRMRADDPTGCMTLVALTGWGAESDRAKSKEAGFDHHLTKPVDLSRVENLLPQVARRQSGRRTA